MGQYTVYYNEPGLMNSVRKPELHKEEVHG
jgi:hypothetical protein